MNTNLLPVSERPLERVLRDSAGCSIAELLSILIGGSQAADQAQLALSEFGSVGQFLGADPGAWNNVGLPLRKDSIARLKAAGELAGRMSYDRMERNGINSPAEAAAVMLPILSCKEQEFVFVLNLDTRNRMIGKPHEVYHGSLNTSMIRVGELFRKAVLINAAAIILFHNHPSGDPSPSPDDVAVTRLVVESGKLLDTPLHDHIIIGANRFVSLKERGLGFS